MTIIAQLVLDLLNLPRGETLRAAGWRVTYELNAQGKAFYRVVRGDRVTIAWTRAEAARAALGISKEN